MKKFILNTLIFVVPFFALYIFNVFNYSQRGAEGDLARMGYFYSNPSPRSLLDEQYDLVKQYTLFSEIDWTTQVEYDVMTIGDSFSEQDSLGYKNFLAATGTSVLHVDRFISGGNPIQTLVSMMNSGVFDYIKPEFIVLQSIERDFNERTSRIDFDEQLNLELLSTKVKQHKSASPNYNLQFFSDATLKMPLNNLQYLFIDKPVFSNTYQVKTTSRALFSNSPDNLLFYKHDVQKIEAKNDTEKTLASIQLLDKLSDLLLTKGIVLIMLVSPDKYDLYFPYIEDKSKLIAPTFFSTYEKSFKKYQNINSYQILSEKIPFVKDIYYYDDTHWSPVGSKIIVEEILTNMKK